MAVSYSLLVERGYKWRLRLYCKSQHYVIASGNNWQKLVLTNSNSGVIIFAQLRSPMDEEALVTTGLINDVLFPYNSIPSSELVASYKETGHMSTNLTAEKILIRSIHDGTLYEQHKQNNWKRPRLKFAEPNFNRSGNVLNGSCTTSIFIVHNSVLL